MTILSLGLLNFIQSSYVIHSRILLTLQPQFLYLSTRFCISCGDMTLRGVRIEQPVIEGLLVIEGYLGKEL